MTKGVRWPQTSGFDLFWRYTLISCYPISMLFCSLHDSKETSTSLNEVTPSQALDPDWVPRGQPHKVSMNCTDGKPKTMVPKMILILNLARTEPGIWSFTEDSVHLQQLARCRNFAVAWPGNPAWPREMLEGIQQHSPVFLSAGPGWEIYYRNRFQ